MMRKVVFLHNSFPAGGAERVTIDIANHVRKYGYETIVLAHKSNEDFGITYPHLVELPDPGKMTSDTNTRFIIDYLNNEATDLLVIPGLSIPTIGRIRRETTCKIVFALHGTPFWEAQSKLYEKKANARGSLAKTLKWYAITYLRERLTHKYEKSTYKSYRDTYDNCDAYIFLCQAYKDKFMHALHIAGDEKMSVIHNSEQQPATVNRDKHDEIIFVGRLTYEDKRVDRLLRIWAMASATLQGWRLRIVGSGTESDRLKALAARLRLDRVTFEGFHRDVKPYYDRASIICLTSTFEGWGLCLTEAQANGVVPIAFGCSDGVKEIISPSGQCGIIVKPFSLRRFAKELAALALDREKLRQMSAKCIEKSKTYSPQLTGSQWVSLFDKLCGNDDN